MGLPPGCSGWIINLTIFFILAVAAMAGRRPLIGNAASICYDCKGVASAT
jgi:hypothetical protein